MTVHGAAHFCASSFHQNSLVTTRAARTMSSFYPLSADACGGGRSAASCAKFGARCRPLLTTGLLSWLDTVTKLFGPMTTKPRSKRLEQVRQKGAGNAMRASDVPSLLGGVGDLDARLALPQLRTQKYPPFANEPSQHYPPDMHLQGSCQGALDIDPLCKWQAPSTKGPSQKMTPRAQDVRPYKPMVLSPPPSKHPLAQRMQSHTNINVMTCSKPSSSGAKPSHGMA